MSLLRLGHKQCLQTKKLYWSFCLLSIVSLCDKTSLYYLMWAKVLISFQSFWTLCGLCLEIANIYGDVRATSTTHPEKGNTTARGVSDANGATPSAGSVPAVNGEHTGVWFFCHFRFLRKALELHVHSKGEYFNINLFFWLCGVFPCLLDSLEKKLRVYFALEYFAPFLHFLLISLFFENGISTR